MATIGTSQLKLLEKLSNACAVSGEESEVRNIVLDEIKGSCDEVKVDALGNVLASRAGTGKNRLRVMFSAHMDEVGFMLVAEDGEGLYRFETVGGIDPRHLVGKPVQVGKDKTPGIIGARPIHLTTADERRRTIALEALRIDIGPANKAKLGDRAAFATKFQIVGSLLIGKALDNRLGVATLIELLKNAHPGIDFLAAFTVQEENGLRGARTAAYAFNPDLALAVDSTPAMDLPSWDGEENQSYNTRLGQGPAIYIADGSTLSDPRLIRHFAAAGEAEKIPFQFRQPGGGGTDAGAIHKQRSGIPSLSVSVPHRYTHSAVSISRIEDWRNTLALLQAAIVRLNPAILAVER